MKEPCRSCPEKVKDFGGCRCQAYLLTGDATNADPVCDLSPHHHAVTEAVELAERTRPEVKPIVFRDDSLAGAENTFGFASEKAGGANLALELSRFCLCEGSRVAILFEQCRSNHVHALVGTLRA